MNLDYLMDRIRMFETENGYTPSKIELSPKDYHEVYCYDIFHSPQPPHGFVIMGIPVDVVNDQEQGTIELQG